MRHISIIQTEECTGTTRCLGVQMPSRSKQKPSSPNLTPPSESVRKKYRALMKGVENVTSTLFASRVPVSFVISYTW